LFVFGEIIGIVMLFQFVLFSYFMFREIVCFLFGFLLILGCFFETDMAN
jgi:hypothetical protein